MTNTHSAKFIGSSMYKNQFLDWGPSKIVYTKSPEQPIHYTNMRSRQGTTYSDAFLLRAASVRKLRKTDSGSITRRPVDGAYVTTNKKLFKGEQSKLNFIVKRKEEKYEPMAYAANLYTGGSQSKLKIQAERNVDHYQLRRHFKR